VFKVPQEESYARFREAVEVVLAAWQHEHLSWHGRYWQFEAVEVLPKPLQQPHPPTWVAVSSPDSLCWAGAQGYSIMLGPHTHYTEIARKREIYRKELEAHGHTIVGRDLPMTRLLAVAETEQAAEDIARQGARWMVGAYMNPAKVASYAILQRNQHGGPGRDPVAHYLDGVAVYGTPARVRDQLQQLREEMFLDYLLCAPLSHTSFLLFTEHVLPHLL
jgi:alkanesulfonate monooxygenase SsuD/methylene tetrahydromethanopterin reductase-like flavin-dependent oxidoreductase (luciferase family)